MPVEVEAELIRESVGWFVCSLAVRTFYVRIYVVLGG